MSAWLIVLITVLACSAINTIITAWRSSSMYSESDTFDFLLGGPVLWFYILIVVTVNPIYKYCQKHKKKDPTVKQPLNQKELDRTVKKIMKIYVRHNKGKAPLVFYFFPEGQFPLDYCDKDYFSDMSELFPRSPIHERLEKKFRHFGYYYWNELTNALIPYFEELTEAERIDYMSAEWVERNKKIKLYKVKGI